MAIRKFKPYTPGTRQRVVTDFSEITSAKPERSLIVSKHRVKGRIVELSLVVIVEVVTKGNIDWSTLEEIKEISMLKLQLYTTILIEMPGWHFYFTKMERKDILSLQLE